MLPASGIAAFLTLAAESSGLPGETLVVSATRLPRPVLSLPAAVDTISRGAIREGNPQVNLSETLNRVPGIVVQNRQNYAQDLQVSSRGFGARASFGVRGVRLIADGIPATMPDGQGQAATFDLASAERIEVLRGPFASLYGNSSGGLVQVFTAEGPARPTLEASLAAGSFGQRRAGVRFGGDGAVNYLASASRYETDGYRAHSAAVREQANVKAGANVAGGRLTLVASALDQPGSQDPLGLTRAQFEADPRQADAAAERFDTRKSVRQRQAGLVYEAGLGGASTLTARGYFGTRRVEQYLGLTGDGPLASGGVVDLDREYGGAGLRWTQRGSLAGEPLTWSLGVDVDRMEERRLGFVNDFGRRGARRRDEDGRVSNRDAYLIAEWRASPCWLLAGGARHSSVRFDSADHYVTQANPDDSGQVRFSQAVPVLGVLYMPYESWSAYANAGGGFETPTFVELAYRPGGATGLNFGLRPARSRHAEAGVKARAGSTLAAEAALFRIETHDEIVPASSAGGRTVFRNAAGTVRRGAELSIRARLSQAFEVHAAYTLLDAEFRGELAGRKLPGVPRNVAYLEATWRGGGGWHAAAEVRRSSRIFVNDANADAAPAYTVVNARVGHEWVHGDWRIASYVRVDNAADRRYAGSVIVAEARGRFFEPAPGRSWFAGVEIGRAF